MENDSERPVDGIDGEKPYYVDSGEKKTFNGEGDFFLKVGGDDIREYGYAPVNYMVKNDPESSLKVVVSTVENAREGSWNEISTDSFFKLWSTDQNEEAVCFLCWHTPESNLLRADGFQKIQYKDGKVRGLYLLFTMESVAREGYPVIFMCDKEGFISPGTFSDGQDDFFRSVISGQSEKMDGGEATESLHKSRDVFGNTALHYAAAFGRTKILGELIAQGADINATNESGMTPLMVATCTAHLDAVSLLLQNGAKTKYRDGEKRTVLHYAAYCGHTAIMAALLENTKDVNKKDASSQMPVHYAINANHDDIVGLLADHNAKVNTDKENLQNSLVANIAGGNYNTVSFLLDQKAEADGETLGTTPLVMAAGASDVEMVDLLIERGADVNKGNNSQVTPLLSACLTGRMEVVKYLLEKDAEVNAQSQNGLSALQAAVLRNDPELIELLVSYGVNIEEKDESGKTPFWKAAMLGHRESMDTLLLAGATCDLNHKDAIELMELAFRYDMPEAVDLAISQCLDASFLFYDKYPSTWVADYYGADEIMALLVEYGAEKSDGEELNIVSMKDLSEKPEIAEYTSIYYPLELKRKYGSRKFVIQIIIDENGEIRFPKMVESGLADIERIVMETITGWRFSVPKDASGQACATIAKLPLVLECDEIEKTTMALTEVDKRPTVVKSFPPKYPYEMRAKNLQGRVVLRIIIDETGKPESVGVAEMTHKGFADAAVAAGKQYEFTPAYYQGEPVKVEVKLPVVFAMEY
jgi:TonB family protein